MFTLTYFLLTNLYSSSFFLFSYVFSFTHSLLLFFFPHLFILLLSFLFLSPPTHFLNGLLLYLFHFYFCREESFYLSAWVRLR